MNAGSNTVSVFSVRGDQLSLRQVVSSGGVFPVSIAVHDGLVYVLNAENGGSVQGYASFLGHLFPIPWVEQIPGPRHTHGHHPVHQHAWPGRLLARRVQADRDHQAERRRHRRLRRRAFGLLSSSPVLNSEPGTVPFAVSFDAAGHLVVANAGTNALATYTINSNGTVTLIDAVGTGASATCWVAPARGFFYASNAGSATVSGYGDAFDGELTLLGSTATDPGTVDASASPNGHFLYVQTGGNGIVDEFQVGWDGSLTEIGSVTVAGAAGGEGIAAS